MQLPGRSREPDGLRPGHGSEPARSGNIASQRCHGDNVAPSIAISGDANVNEGSAYSLTLGAVTDPGTDTVTS